MLGCLPALEVHFGQLPRVDVISRLDPGRSVNGSSVALQKQLTVPG